MIVVDASALIAIHFEEAEARRYAALIYDSGEAVLAAPTAFEYMMVAIGRHGEANAEKAARVIADLGIGIVSFTAEMHRLATGAFLRFGKGRHPAGLNFGDCMAYALARSRGAPLLFKGTDFALTDIEAAG